MSRRCLYVFMTKATIGNQRVGDGTFPANKVKLSGRNVSALETRLGMFTKAHCHHSRVCQWTKVNMESTLVTKYWSVFERGRTTIYSFSKSASSASTALTPWSSLNAATRSLTSACPLT